MTAESWIDPGLIAAEIARQEREIEQRERPLVEQLERAKRKLRTVYIDGKPIGLPGAGEMPSLTARQDLRNAVLRSAKRDR